MQNGGQLVHHEDVVLNLLNQFVRRTRQQLDQKAAGGENVVIGPDQHTKTAGGRNLFALDKIGREILGNLTGDERHTSNVRLLHSKITADSQSPIAADQAAHVKLAILACRKIRFRFIHVPPDIAGTVRYGDNAAHRPAAIETQSQGILFTLHGIAQQGSAKQCSPERSTGSGAQAMDCSGFFYHIWS